MFQRLFVGLRRLFSSVVSRLRSLYSRFRRLRPRNQIIAVVVAVLVIGGIMFGLSGGKPADTASNVRSVTIASVSELSGNATGASLLGTVRSAQEAQLLAQASGPVTAVHTTVGASVPAGFVIAELQNSIEAAQVLSAQGAYEATLASVQAAPVEDVRASARTTYRSAFTTLDTALSTYVDELFGGPTPIGPELLIYPHSISGQSLTRERQTLIDRMNAWRSSLAQADSRDPSTLLSEAQSVAQETEAFIRNLSQGASDEGSQASAAQIAALVTARGSVNGLTATLSAEVQAYKAGNSATTAGSDAKIKQALGALRLAQASYEKTVVRAPIAGVVDSLPIHVGDYVTNLQPVASVAQKGALEIVAHVSEDNLSTLSAGMKVMVEGSYEGIVTSVAPGLDAVTKQIEVRIAVTGKTALVDGQSVRVSLPSVAPVATTATSTGPVLLPLSAVKLTADSRAVFTVDANNRLVAVPVTIGDVRGERIEITSALPIDTKIVTDARGLSEGQAVNVATQ